MKTIKRHLPLLCICAVLTSSLLGCSNSENGKLRADLTKSESEKATLQQELVKLKQTDQYFFNQAIEQRRAKNYAESNKSLNELLEKFPQSSLLNQAKSNLSKNRDDVAAPLFNKAMIDYNAKKFSDAKQNLLLVTANHSQTKFYPKAKQLLQNIDKEQQQQEAEDRRRAARQAEEARHHEQRQAEIDYRKSCKLEIVSWTWGESDSESFLEAQGQVKNISDESIDGVEAVVSFKTSSGDFVKTDDALIDFRPILPGQTSTFKVITSNNPAIKKASIQFKTFDGGELPVYVRKKERQWTGH